MYHWLQEPHSFDHGSPRGEIVSDWLHNLPVPWMALVIFGFTYLLAAAIYAGVATLSGRLAKSFKVVSVGMLPSLGIIFGLFVAFTAAQVWADNDRATASISREASALRSILVFAASFPGESETALDNLIKDYVRQAASVLLAIAMVHAEDRGASAISLGLFATGIAASVLLIAAHDRPFIGQLAVTPDPLLQIVSNAQGN